MDQVKTKSGHDVMDTLLLAREALDEWQIPPFQRQLCVNSKVTQVSDELKRNGGIVPGVITVGLLGGVRYLIDGQHRLQAFRMSELPECIVNVHMIRYSTMAEMGAEFARLNGVLKRMSPDDVLRALEDSRPGMQLLRKEAPFIGYDNIRRGASAPLLSMSLALRAWFAGGLDVPSSSVGTAHRLSDRLDVEEATKASAFFRVCFAAWGADPEYFRVWGALNLTMSSWLWHHCVLSTTSARTTKLTPQLFKAGATALTASSAYMDFLLGRNLNDRDRAPCYTRVKAIMCKRIAEESGRKPTLPAPPWAPGQTNAERSLWSST